MGNHLCKLSNTYNFSLCRLILKIIFTRIRMPCVFIVFDLFITLRILCLNICLLMFGIFLFIIFCKVQPQSFLQTHARFFIIIATGPQ